MPYRFVQRVTGDVDFRIMGTFVEFYTTLLGFINFRLYTSIGLIYPPRFNTNSDEQGGELGAFILEGKGIEPVTQIDVPGSGQKNGVSELNENVQKQVDEIGELPEYEDGDQEPATTATIEKISDTIDTFETTGEGADILPQPQMSDAEVSNLFAPFSFFLSRETPRQPLEFILRAFGCKRVGWDAVLGDGAFTHNESDTGISHQIVDRPPLPPSTLPEAPLDTEVNASAMATLNLTPGSRIPGRTYIQPQWVWDCINEGKLLRPDIYAPEATLPPHLSPWVKPTKGAYNPSIPLAEQEREGEAEEAEDDIEEEKGEGVTITNEVESVPKPLDLLSLTNVSSDNDMDIAGSSSSEEEVVADNFSGFNSPSSPAALSADEADQARTQHQVELEAEAAGLTFSEASVKMPMKGILKKSKGDEARKKAARRRLEEEEELERRKMMMGRKKRKVVDKMLYSNRKKDEEAEKLRGKRRRIEGGRR